MSTAPIGILGGTFDPVHFGHLRLAQEVGDALRLAEVRLIPTGTPPHRAAPHASPAQRYAMVQLAISGNSLLTADEREVKRSGLGYTVDTLIELRREVGPSRPLCVLLGADAFLELATWHHWRELFSYAHLIVAHRPGFPPDSWPARMPEPLAREYGSRSLRQPLAAHLSPAGGIATQSIAALDISASMIRASLACGTSPRYLLPDPVLDYIHSNNLYHGGQ